MSTNSTVSSGSGTRPTTSGGTDNIGAAEAMDTGHAATGEPNVGPAHPERMQHKRADAAGAEQDDSVPMGLHGNQHSTPNTEPPEPGTSDSPSGAPGSGGP